MEYKLRQSGQEVEAALSGRLTFVDYQAFRDLLKVFQEHAQTRRVINLADLDFIDSSGLGMLLIALDESRKINRSLVLRGAQGQVKRTIEIAAMTPLFEVES